MILPARAGSGTPLPPQSCPKALGKSMSASVDGWFPHDTIFASSVTAAMHVNQHLVPDWRIVDGGGWSRCGGVKSPDADYSATVMYRCSAVFHAGP
jgi:hypothetical protein